MAEILVSDVRARRLSAAGDLLFVGIDMTRRRVGVPVFPPVSPVLRPVFSSCLFPRYFNDLSCI
jgi:hypothetical protein